MKFSNSKHPERWTGWSSRGYRTSRKLGKRGTVVALPRLERLLEVQGDRATPAMLRALRAHVNQQRL